jgi:hypothetical protein
MGRFTDDDSSTAVDQLQQHPTQQQLQHGMSRYSPTEDSLPDATASDAAAAMLLILNSRSISTCTCLFLILK